MRGVFFQQPFEIKVEVAGEQFRQGDSLPCSLSVKNHSTTRQSLSGLRLQLAVGDFKKIKQKSQDAFEVLASAELPDPGDIEPQQQTAFAWTFALDRNCPITDKSQSLHLLYGGIGAAGATGQALVTVLPHARIQAFIELLESTFQFVLKGQKSAEGWVQTKLKPPTSRRLTLVEELMLGSRFDGDVLQLNYSFKVKRFEAGELSLNVRKGRVEVEQRLEPSEYLISGEFLNHAAIEAKIEEALRGVSSNL